MLKTLGKTTWDKIEVGEVFACDAKYLGWIIMYKITDLKVMDLAYDYLGTLENEGDILKWGGYKDKLYKLPKSVQRLWAEV